MAFSHTVIDPRVTATFKPDHEAEYANQIEIQGTYLSWVVPGPRRPKKPPKKRGRVSTFSRAARLRMICLFNRLDWERIKNVLFLTMTYPDDVECENKTVFRRHRAEFWRKLEAYMGRQVCALWRQEWKPRKTGCRKDAFMPHMHYLILREQFISIEEITEMWKRTLGVQQAVCWIEQVESVQQARKYVAKYCAKESVNVPLSLLHTDAPAGGRQWGVNRKELLPMAEIFNLEGSEDDQLASLRDYLLAGREAVNEFGSRSFKVLGPLAVIARGILFDGTIDNQP